MGIPVAIAGAVTLAAALFIGHGDVHAAMTAPPLDDQSINAISSLDHAMEQLAARVTPSVVNIAVTSTPSADETSDEDGGQGQGGGIQGLPPGLQQFFGPGGPLGGGGRGRMQQPQQQQLQHGIGSGVIISSDGYIVTNNHVVDSAKNIKVTLHDRRILSAKLIGVDKLTDLAVIKVDATNLPAISWGDSGKLEPGQTVLAFGSPFGYFQFSVTRGIVSAVDRPNPYSDDARKPGGYIQTDAAINPGNSGGPLVNAHGQLIGINTFIISNNGSFAGAGFAIPSQLAQNVTSQLIAHGKVEHGYVGISMNDVTPDNAEFFGVKDAAGAIVSQVSPDSPGSKAGLKQGDVITSMNGSKVLNSGALQVAVSEVTPGTKIALGILRDGKPMTVDVTLGQFSAKGTQVADNDGDGSQGAKSGKLGLAVSDLTSDLRQQLNAPEQVHGAVVQNVRPGSAADEAGLQPGDVILEVNRQGLASASQFVDKVHAVPAGKDVLLLVWSKGNASYRTLRPEAANQNG